MSSVAGERRWMYRDLVALPDDCLRHELLDGEHVVSPSPGTVHQQISVSLLAILLPYLEATSRGQLFHAPYDVKLTVFTVVVPDLVYFTAERFERVVNDRHATAAPDLVVEILSPGTRRRDKGRKRAVYEREGVGEYWIIDPETKQATVLRRQAEGTTFTTAVTLTHARCDVIESLLFPGLRIPLTRVFR